MNSGPDVDNVIVLVVDALRADRVGAYGSDRELTPAIDSLAAKGTTFEKAFACINTTDPSVTSLHTGKYPRSTVIHHGGLVTEEEKRRVEAAAYLPETLSESGVRTVATGRVMGRWHPRGFDEYAWSSVGATEMKVSKALKRVHPILHQVVAGCYNTIADTFKSESEEGENEVEALLAEMGDGPVYGFVHLMDTHAWYDADSELVDELLATNDYPDGNLRDFFEKYGESPIVTKLLEPHATGADYEAGLARLYARYDATVREADQKVKRLIDGLKQQECWEDTALFVLSDHGESLHEHGIHFDHHGLYDQTVRVPLITHIPGEGGGRVDEFVQIHDLAPTILDLFGVNGFNDTNGRSLLGYLSERDEVPESRDCVILEEAHTQRFWGVRTDQYKFIEHVPDDTVADFWDTDSLECGYCRRQHGDAVELYDLQEDPDETTNIASKCPEVVAAMQNRLTAYEESLSVTETDDATVTYEDEEQVMKRLEDLGYR